MSPPPAPSLSLLTLNLCLNFSPLQAFLLARLGVAVLPLPRLLSDFLAV